MRGSKRSEEFIMNAKDKDKLITHRVYLVEHVNTDGLLTSLLAKKTINLRTKATIEKAGSIYQQVEALLDVLNRGGPKTFNDFCDSLKENDQEFIVAHIENESEKTAVKSVRPEKDVDEFVEILAFRDNNNVVVKVPITGAPQSPAKRCCSVPSMSPSKGNGLETRYALKHFWSVPEKSPTKEDLDQVPSKLTKLDSGDICPDPSDLPSSKKQRLMESSNLEFENDDQDLMHQKIINTSRDFYFKNYKNAYKMDRIPRGQALIINITEIDGMTPRKGSNIDATNLRTLLHHLHFLVSMYDGKEMTATNIIQKVQEFAQMKAHADADATVVCFLSHGDDGHIFGSDGQRIALTKLYSYFDNVHCPSLQDKPKIFIIQACRGNLVDYQTAVNRMGDLTPPIDEADGPHTLTSSSSTLCAPSRSDMIICYPTQQGYRAWRNRERGSWFVQAIVKVFMEYACREDICAMMNRVNNMVSRMVSNCSNENFHGTMQMSEYHSSLTKPHMYFFPGIGSA